MSIAVNIDAEAIKEQVAKAIVESVIGGVLHDQIQAAFKSYNVNRAVQAAVNQAISNETKRLIETQYNELLQLTVKEKLEKVMPATVEEFADKISVKLNGSW